MQEFDLDPTQMKEVIVVLEKLGFLTSVEVQRSHSGSLLEELIVPGFEALNTNASFSLSLMNLTSNKRPVSIAPIYCTSTQSQSTLYVRSLYSATYKSTVSTVCCIV